MKKHNTPELRSLRQCNYIILRYFGYSSRQARIFRDWTEPKILKLLRGEIVPIR